MIQVAHITAEQAERLRGVEFAPSSYCNPVMDGLGRLVISIAEMEGLGLQCEVVEWVELNNEDSEWPSL